jgi:hypothetical protein
MVFLIINWFSWSEELKYAWIVPKLLPPQFSIIESYIKTLFIWAIKIMLSNYSAYKLLILVLLIIKCVIILKYIKGICEVYYL